MNDLISRNKLIEHLNVCLSDSDGRTPITDAVLTAIKCAVEQMPTIDAVEVVRCKDCRHCRNMPYGMCYLHTEPSTNFKGYKGDAVCVEADDFCSYGERKEVSE